MGRLPTFFGSRFTLWGLTRGYQDHQLEHLKLGTRTSQGILDPPCEKRSNAMFGLRLRPEASLGWP